MTSMGKIWALLAAAGLISAVAVVRAQVAPPQHDAAWHNEQALYLLNLKSEDGWSSTANGLRYRKVKAGPGGARPSPTDTVTIHYAGRLLDGTEFDSSYARNEPAEFGLQQVISGWTEGLGLMPVGSKYRFWIPSELGYGARGTPGGPIGPNATLVFDVELLAIPD